jgi:hypothetical protein
MGEENKTERAKQPRTCLSPSPRHEVEIYIWDFHPEVAKVATSASFSRSVCIAARGGWLALMPTSTSRQGHKVRTQLQWC